MTFDPDHADREPQTRVVNLRNESYDIYIGRAGKGQTGYYGNRHSIGWCSLCNKMHDREACIAAFKKEFLTRIERDADFREGVLAMKGKRLGCFCKQRGQNIPCHGDVYVDYLSRIY